MVRGGLGRACRSFCRWRQLDDCALTPQPLTIVSLVPLLPNRAVLPILSTTQLSLFAKGSQKKRCRPRPPARPVGLFSADCCCSYSAMGTQEGAPGPNSPLPPAPPQHQSAVSHGLRLSSGKQGGRTHRQAVAQRLFPGAAAAATARARSTASRLRGPLSTCLLAPSFAFFAVAYILGIALLVIVAMGLVLMACWLRRKDRRHLAALQEARRQADAAEEARREAQAAEAARRLKEMVIPVVILQVRRGQRRGCSCCQAPRAARDPGQVPGRSRHPWAHNCQCARVPQHIPRPGSPACSPPALPTSRLLHADAPSVRLPFSASPTVPAGWQRNSSAAAATRRQQVQGAARAAATS